MEILLWLVPPVIVTLVAMGWVSWIGRAGRGEVDPEEAVRRLAAALEKDHVVPAGTPRRPREPATGVAVRRRVAVQKPEPHVADEPDHQPGQLADEERRAS